MAAADYRELLQILKDRFEKNTQRHPDIAWDAVEARLEANPEKLRVLYKMEETGGEPDVIGYDPEGDVYIFCDCAAQSPTRRRSLCYDRIAREKRKKHPPASSAMEMAEEMGIELLDEEQYRHLQTLGEFDTKTSSWIKTPDAIRKLGGALFGDRRYGRVFTYHNGADSYYSGRGFRGMLKV